MGRSLAPRNNTAMMAPGPKRKTNASSITSTSMARVAGDPFPKRGNFTQLDDKLINELPSLLENQYPLEEKFILKNQLLNRHLWPASSKLRKLYGRASAIDPQTHRPLNAPTATDPVAVVNRNNNNVPVSTRDFLFCFNNCGSSSLTLTEQEVEQYHSGILREICDPLIGDGRSASVHVASNRVTRDLNAVTKEDAAASNSISESTNLSIWEEGVAVVNSNNNNGNNNNNVPVFNSDSYYHNNDNSYDGFLVEDFFDDGYFDFISKFIKVDRIPYRIPFKVCGSPLGDGVSASVHVASNRVTRDLNAVNKEDAASANSISESTNLSMWEKGKSIGSGGFGIVYVARNSYKKHVVFFISDRETGDLCAIKELKDIHKLGNTESLQKEIKILSQLEHTNVVKYYGHEIVGCDISLYMEYIEPGSLKKYISDQRVLPEPLIRNFTAQILSGLVYLHSKRVVHRDIKPHNLLVDSNNIVKLVDFGLAKHLEESVGNHSTLATPYYAAPEVLQQTEYKSSLEGYAADIWSLGCVIIEMLSGEHPWPDCNWVQAFYNVSIKKQRPPIPDKLCKEGKHFLERCFGRTPADRPSAAELQNHPFVKSQNLSYGSSLYLSYV